MRFYSIITMPYERKWSGCKIYSKWVTDDGVTWTVEDLAPEDDEKAVQLMTTIFINDEPMFSRLGISKDEASLTGAAMFWAKLISQRTSVACYRHSNGLKEIAAMNICPVVSIDDPELEIPEEAPITIKCLVGSMKYLESLVEIHEILGTDQYLSGAGLLVVPKYRGARIGAKVLSAREFLCRELGIKATATLFTGPASQKSALNSGFTPIFERTFAELAEVGFYFPGDQSKTIRMMYKIYNFSDERPTNRNSNL